MNEYDRRSLPLAPGQLGTHPGPSCEPKVGVTREEAAIVAAIHQLRNRVDGVRRRLDDAEGPERDRLARELDALRAERTELERRREAAFRSKMIMLGHLPEDDEAP